MTFKFFKNVDCIEELKEQYKKLCFKHHPDKGGKTEDMQQINAEFDELKKKVANIHRNKDGKTYKASEEKYTAPDEFRDIINAIINFNIKIELCGSWLWAFNAYNYKKELHCKSKAQRKYDYINLKHGGRFSPAIFFALSPVATP